MTLDYLSRSGWATITVGGTPRPGDVLQLDLQRVAFRDPWKEIAARIQDRFSSWRAFFRGGGVMRRVRYVVPQLPALEKDAPLTPEWVAVAWAYHLDVAGRPLGYSARKENDQEGLPVVRIQVER